MNKEKRNKERMSAEERKRVSGNKEKVFLDKINIERKAYNKRYKKHEKLVRRNKEGGRQKMR